MKIELITPAKAAELLSNNNSNRSVSALRVNKYASEMIKGNWVLNGETIKVGESGVLLDGQHRLKAVIKSGVPISTFVIYGLPDKELNKIFESIDSGKARNLSDVLSCSKVKNHKTVAAAGRFLYWMESDDGSVRTMGAIDSIKQIVVPYILDNEIILQKTIRVIEPFYKQTQIVKMSISVGFASYLLKNGCDTNLVKKFFETIFLGGGEIGSAPNAARNYILKEKLNRLSHREVMFRELLSVCWNKFLFDSPVSALRINLKENFTKIIIKR